MDPKKRFMDRKDILSFAETYFDSCSGRSMSEENIKKERNKLLAKKCEERGLSSINVSNPSDLTVKGIVSQVKQIVPTVGKTDKSKAQTNARFAADTSLRSAMSYALTVAYTHLMWERQIHFMLM